MTAIKIQTHKHTDFLSWALLTKTFAGQHCAVHSVIFTDSLPEMELTQVFSEARPQVGDHEMYPHQVRKHIVSRHYTRSNGSIKSNMVSITYLASPKVSPVLPAMVAQVGHCPLYTPWRDEQNKFSVTPTHACFDLIFLAPHQMCVTFGTREGAQQLVLTDAESVDFLGLVTVMEMIHSFFTEQVRLHTTAELLADAD